MSARRGLLTSRHYLGLPNEHFELNGLGIHIKNSKNELEIADFLIRDRLTPEEYIKANFDECDFEIKDLALEELEFFNPYWYGNVSKSWHKEMKSDITMARKSLSGPYYRVIRKEDGTYLFKDDKNPIDPNAFTGAEFRRNYVALKKYYDNPMQLLICQIDEEYAHIRILGQIPNREYYYILMNAWPKNGFLDRNNFIVRNKLTSQISKVLNAISIISRKGEFYG